MKNDECTIRITTKLGWTQSYHKRKNGWVQINPNGKTRIITAEQLLSHILPRLASNGAVTVHVEPDHFTKMSKIGAKRKT